MFRRFLRVRSLLQSAALALAGVLALSGSLAIAEDDDMANAGDESAVRVQKVVLFNSGVGYIEHGGKVQGDATVDLKFNVDDINDLLKSMVLQDLGGGQISTVTYGSRDPITKTLQSFAIDLTQNPTLGQLLGQIRGEEIEIDAPTKVKGTIVGVETKRQKIGDNDIIEVEYLNVLTEEGLRRVQLDLAGQIKLNNKDLDKEFRQALRVLASGHATDKKTVTLQFAGEGEREVRVGYIQEAPVWKTSYRLVLDDEDKPFLQGWAIVENTTDTDWEDVRLSLVSGRPISFVMDLYSPLYATRPTVVPELFASLRPQVYEQDLAKREKALEARSQIQQRALASRPATKSAPAADAFGRAQDGSGVGGVAEGESAAEMSLHYSGENLSRSVPTAAAGGDVGELFQYEIKEPVTLARQKSAMLPIVNETVEGKKVSIYNAKVHAKHPLNGIELKNSSDVHLMQGPITVFDGGVYAGDARIPDLPPGSDRLLSYALDLDVEVAPTRDDRPQDLVSVRIAKGTLIATYNQSRSQKYVVKNSGDEEKRVLIEYPIEPRWKLVEPKEPAEKTRDVYRFAVTAEPGKPVELKVEELRNIRQDVALTNLDLGTIQFYLRAETVSQEVKDALREVVKRKSELADFQRRNEQLKQEIATIDQEQQRIRENMKSIDRNTDLYNRYVKKFTDQEDRIESIREDSQKLEEEIAAAKKGLDEYLTSLDIE